jgi:hypothetical protein
MRIVFFFILIGAIFLSCSIKEDNGLHQNEELDVKHTPTPNDWIEINDGLFVSPKGEIGFASNPLIANYTKQEIRELGKFEICENRFLTTLRNDNEMKLKDVVDTNTFVNIGYCFYKDKNNIYQHYDMCDGGFLHIFSNDTSSFRSLNSNYISFKSEIYYFREGKIDADFETFKVSFDIEQLAMDKHGFFEFGKRVDEKELITDSYLRDAVSKLKRQ